jgi:hypothetical protein
MIEIVPKGPGPSSSDVSGTERAGGRHDRQGEKWRKRNVLWWFGGDKSLRRKVSLSP